MIKINQTLTRNGGGFLFTTDSGDPGSGGIKSAIYFNCMTIAPLIQNRDDRCMVKNRLKIMWITIFKKKIDLFGL